MITIEMIWSAIDNLAAHNNMSCSGLARYCGLDATTFNKSKRNTLTGARCLCMTTVLRVLNRLELSLADFESYMDEENK